MSILVLSSLCAGLLAFQNAASRYFFAFARGGVFPTALSRVSGRGAPHLALLPFVLLLGGYILARTRRVVDDVLLKDVLS